MQTRTECSIYFKIRIFSSSANQYDNSLLNGRKQRILLRARETMNLIDEHNGANTLTQQRFIGAGDNFAQFGNRASNGRQSFKLRVRRMRNNVSKRGFSHARRAIQKKRCKRIVVNCLIKPGAFPANILLTNNFAQTARTHTPCKGRTAFPFLLVYLGK